MTRWMFCLLLVAQPLAAEQIRIKDLVETPARMLLEV